jgi:hypothetical protein
LKLTEDDILGIVSSQEITDTQLQQILKNQEFRDIVDNDLDLKQWAEQIKYLKEKAENWDTVSEHGKSMFKLEQENKLLKDTNSMVIKSNIKFAEKLEQIKSLTEGKSNDHTYHIMVLDSIKEILSDTGDKE